MIVPIANNNNFDVNNGKDKKKKKLKLNTTMKRSSKFCLHTFITVLCELIQLIIRPPKVYVFWAKSSAFFFCLFVLKMQLLPIKVISIYCYRQKLFQYTITDMAHKASKEEGWWGYRPHWNGRMKWKKADFLYFFLR